MRKDFLIIFILLSSLCCAAQSKNRVFRSYGLAHGLTNSRVNSVAEDNNGMIWVGTRGGLFKFDGYDFQLFESNPEDSTAISANDVSCIVPDKEGLLWIGTWEGGLNRYDPDTKKFTSFWNEAHHDANTIFRIKLNKNGNLWVGTYGGGLYLFDTKTLTFTRALSESPEDEVSFPHAFIDIDSSFMLIADMFQGVMKYDYDTKMISKPEDSTLAEYGTNLANNFEKDAAGNLWFMTKDKQVCRYNPKTGSKRKYQIFDKKDKTWTIAYVWDLYPASPNEIWIGTPKGLYILNPNTGNVETYKNDQGNRLSVPSSNVFHITKDSRGLIWVGTWEGGLAVHDPRGSRFNIVDFHGFHDSKTVHSIEVLSDTVMVIGSSKGVFTYDMRSHQLSRLPTKGPESIYFDNSIIRSLKWIEADSFVVMSEEVVYTLTLRDSIVRKVDFKGLSGTLPVLNSLRDLYIESDYWIFSSWAAGIVMVDFKRKLIKHFSGHEETKFALKSNYILSFFKDRKGRYWVGTKDGLMQYLRGTDQFIDIKPEGQPEFHPGIRDIVDDDDGNLWLATNQGLIKYRPEDNTTDNYFKIDGLADNILYCVEIQDENLWITCNSGLSQMNLETHQFRNFDMSDGLLSNEFTYNAKFVDDLGNLYFGTNEGLLFFDPAHIQGTFGPPQIVFTDLFINNRQVVAGKNSVLKSDINTTSSVTLNPNQRNISLAFTGLTFRNSDDNRFKYILEGYDPFWIEINSSERKVTYTNLDPGTYTLKVLACNQDGIWTEEAKILTIVITPTFFETWWFFVLMSLLALTIVYLLYRARLQSIEQKNRLLELKVQKRTHELRLQKGKIEDQNQELGSRNKMLQDSLNYGKTIQDAMLPRKETISKWFPDWSLLFLPKDTVSGDFYWAAENPENPDQLFLAIVDCTGHGVPGAFMSLIGMRQLNLLILEKKILDPATVLSHMDLEIAQNLNHRKTGNFEGMDIILLKITKNNGHHDIEYSGAKRPLWIKRANGHLEQLKTNRKSIGSERKLVEVFETYKTTLYKDEMAYLFTDGYTDQNNIDRVKIGRRKLAELIEYNDLEPVQKAQYLRKHLREFMKGTQQRDDITLLILKGS